jgi:hypothetical protein
MAEGVGGGTYESLRNACVDQSAKVKDLMDAMGETDDPSEMLNLSLKLMEEQQMLTTLTESFTKAMKANTDEMKSAINSMA